MGYSKFGNSKTKSKNGKGLRQSKRFTKRNKNKKPRNLKKEPFMAVLLEVIAVI